MGRLKSLAKTANKTDNIKLNQLQEAANAAEPDARAKAESIVSSFSGDTRAESQFMTKGVNIAVGILVVGLLTAYLLPIAINEIVAVDTTGWGNAEAQLFVLLPLFFVLAILLFVVHKAMSA